MDILFIGTVYADPIFSAHPGGPNHNALKTGVLGKAAYPRGRVEVSNAAVLMINYTINSTKKIDS